LRTTFPAQRTLRGPAPGLPRVEGIAPTGVSGNWAGWHYGRLGIHSRNP
jgi:hypothetical protein